MMGGFKFIFVRSDRKSWRTAGHPARATAALLAAALLCGAGPVAAGNSPTDESPSQPTAPNRSEAVEVGTTPSDAKARVSMSPEEPAGSTRSPARSKRGAGTGEDGLPLTRAAARQRVEAMSPTAWLAHYGAISIERPR